MKRNTPLARCCAAILTATCLGGSAYATSHMDAPLITLDPAANTTDVYAFVRMAAGQKVLVTALGVYPHEEPSVGPNKYNFDDNVLYEIHVATGSDLAAGKPTYSYQFQFKTEYKSKATILQSYLGVINDIGDSAQNLVQTYTITKVDRSNNSDERRRRTIVGTGIVICKNAVCVKFKPLSLIPDFIFSISGFLDLGDSFFLFCFPLQGSISASFRRRFGRWS